VQLGEPGFDFRGRHVHGSGQVRASKHWCLARIDGDHPTGFEQLSELVRLERALGARQKRIEHVPELSPLHGADLAALCKEIIAQDLSADEPTRATGELQVRDGQYTALARKLDIERGRLIFSGGLLVDPAVDIRAVKEFPDVKAGVNVRGTLREPRLSFFSEPSIPQSQIVSLLLAGGTLESAQNQNSQGTPQAKQEVAGQAAALLVSQFGGKIGLPDISVESDFDRATDQQGTSLVLGKYLSPRLYVSWGVSLTESINTFKMRYTINDRWTVKTEAGKEGSADLVYTIEK